jgi:hypothetical protein
LIFLGCNDNLIHDEPDGRYASKKFKYFEMSYKDGWVSSFSFSVDSNNIFFTQGKFDTVYYGILPDTLSRRIDSVLSIVQKDTSIHSNNEKCDDCTVVSIIASTGVDTLKLIQHGRISRTLFSLTEPIRKFIDSNKHDYFAIYNQYKTANDVFPPPKLITERANSR